MKTEAWSARPSFHLSHRIAQFPFLSALAEKTLVCDGAMGTLLQHAGLSATDFAGKEGCNEILCETRPSVVADVHSAYLSAGADIIETNSFGSTSVVLAEYGIADQSESLSRKAAELAKTVANSFSTPDWPRFVAGSVGPTTKLIQLGHIAWEDLFRSYMTHMRGLLAGGVDLLLIETAQDLLGVKCAVLAARQAMRETGREVPIFAQLTVETMGAMLVGTDVTAALPTLAALELDGVGLNCATGPDLMQEHVRFLGEHAGCFVSAQPNAGLPRNEGGVATYDLSPDMLADYQERFVKNFGVSMVGGCCGTTPAHISALAKRIKQTPRKHFFGKLRPETHALGQASSLYVAVPLVQEPAPLLIGERSNANGSKKFREFLLRDDFEGLVEIGREQVAEGAHLIDVCTAYVGRDEKRDMREVLRRYTTQITQPLVIDTTQLDVMEEALKMLGGRALLNSVNLEDGEDRANRICALAREYGAGLIALTIDEQGMAKTCAKKVEVAQRLYALAVEKNGLSPSALLFDPLTFTIASGDEESRNAALETLSAIRLIKETMPGVLTLLGVSNVSFGLKPLPRQVLNSVFLSEAILNGLDAAIVSPAKILPLSKLKPEEVELARDLIYDRRREGYDPLFQFVERFSNEGSGQTDKKEEFGSLEDRLAKHIVDGKKIGLDKLLEEALNAGHPPLHIINQILLPAMKTVGDLFASGQMQLPFVLQSAETMKMAVSVLEPYMDKQSGTEKGVIVLATVKGDVHDIGKNLVDILLSNNGYRVMNLGIKQPIDAILDAAEQNKADAIGMSGLLVKSTVVMKENLELMASRGWSIPVLCGGAALNRAYVEGPLSAAYRTGEVYYGLDAFTGLRLMDELCGHTKPEDRTLTGPGRKKLAGQRISRELERAEEKAKAQEASTAYVPSDVPQLAQIPTPPFWGTRILEGRDIPLREVFGYLNRAVLFRGQWQYRRGRRSEEEYRHFIQETVEPKFYRWCERAIERRYLQPKVVYGYFPCYAEENALVVLHPKGTGQNTGQGNETGKEHTEAARFVFPRQPHAKRLCISDFFRSKARALQEGFDVLAVSLVTMGERPSQVGAELFSQHRYDDYLHFHGLAVESTEALAEWLHKRVRHELGIGALDAPLVEHLFQQGYQGSRYSFGYPACPKLEDHVPLFRLLEAERIGVSLSEEFQIVPEQSTAAVIAHHPDARYFSITSA